MEPLRGLQYKLCLIVVPLTSPFYIYGDNMSVIHTIQCPESTLKRKSHSLCYHVACKSIAMEESLIGHIATNKNVADLLTTVLYGQGRRHVIGEYIYNFFDFFYVAGVLFWYLLQT